MQLAVLIRTFQVAEATVSASKPDFLQSECNQIYDKALRFFIDVEI